MSDFYKYSADDYRNFFLFEASKSLGSTEIAALRIGIKDRQATFALSQETVQELLDFLENLVADHVEEVLFSDEESEDE